MAKHRFATEEMERFSTVDLIAELKRRYQVLSRPTRNSVVLGHPFSGVDTQAGFLRKEWGMCKISRKEVIPKPGEDVTEAIRRLSDEIGSFRCRRGFVLENFPQTVEEAQAFDAMLEHQHPDRKTYQAFLLTMPSETDSERTSSLEAIRKRAMGNLVHEASGRVYNETSPELSPLAANVDDITGEPLVCPRTDIPAIIEETNRWWSIKEPMLKKYFGRRLYHVDSSLSRDQISAEFTRKLLDEDYGVSKSVSGELKSLDP
jgi:adenylate kinase